jgi:hypothetical protein
MITDILQITPYKYKKIGNTTFSIKYNGEKMLIFENSTEDHVKQITGFMNGAFREGVIFGNFNKIDE